MQDAALEVEFNILAVDRFRNKTDRDRGRGRSEASTSGSSASHPQVDELTNMVKYLSAEMEKMESKGSKFIRVPKMLITEVTLEDQIIPLKHFQESLET
jgi:hypothetical protein